MAKRVEHDEPEERNRIGDSATQEKSQWVPHLLTPENNGTFQHLSFLLQQRAKPDFANASHPPYPPFVMQTGH